MISLIYTVFFLATQGVSDTQGPPPPPSDGPDGPGLPIDDNIWILLVIGILFGIYIIYKRNQAINKAA